MVSFKLCQGLNRSWRAATQRKKYSNATIAIIYSFQINVSRVQLGPFLINFISNLGKTVYVPSKVIYKSRFPWITKDWSETCRYLHYIRHKTHFHTPVGIWSRKIIFFDCFLPQLISSSFPPVPPPLLLYIFFIFHAVVCSLQWMETRGVRWSPCIPRWSSASRAHHLRWALPWRRPWDPLKTSCSPLCPESRMESPDRIHSQLCFFTMKKILNVSSWSSRYTRGHTWTPCEPRIQ